jgi:hypothetical protein
MSLAGTFKIQTTAGYLHPSYRVALLNQLSNFAAEIFLGFSLLWSSATLAIKS